MIAKALGRLPRRMDGPPNTRRLAVSTAAFGGATFISRVVGLLREIVAARMFGTSPALGAFLIAFNIPNLVRSLFADSAISAAFVPVFIELRATKGEAAAWRVASIVLWMTAIILGALSAVLILIAPLLMPIFVPGSSINSDLVVTLSQIMFPIVVILGLTGVVTGILNSYHVFGLPAFAPVVWNLVIVGFLLAQPHSVDAYAWGVLVATVVQFLIPLPLLRGRSHHGLVFSLAWDNPDVRRILRLMVPVTIGLGLINLNLTIDLAVGSLGSSNVVPDLNYAFRLFMLPQGLFSVAVSAVLFPEISRLAALRDTPGYVRRIAEGSRTIVFLLLPAAALSAVLSRPIVRLLFQHGQFTPSATTNVANTLIAFSLGLVFNGLALLFTRAFFARQESRVPTEVACINLVLNAVLDILLYKPFGAAGIALGTSIVTSWNAAALAVLLRRRVGSLHLREVAGETGRIAIATTFCAATAIVVWWPLDSLLGRSIPAQAVSLGMAFFAAGAVYLAAGRMLRLADVAVLQGLLPSRR
jgi:putative peptidoglycan lipid II flippase